jgi:hypothetical protein
MPKTHIEFLNDICRKIKQSPKNENDRTVSVTFTQEEINGLEERMSEINGILLERQIQDVRNLARTKGVMDNA